MATELSNVCNSEYVDQVEGGVECDQEPGPSPFYKTRVRRAWELLTEAAAEDTEYQGDMMMEGIREGLINAAMMVVGKLVRIAEGGENAR